MATSLPSFAEVLGQVRVHPGVIVAATAAAGLIWAGGRAITTRSGIAETAAVGMGVYALLMTGIGVAGMDLRLGVAAFAALAIWALTARRSAGLTGQPVSLARAVCLLLPLMAVLSGRVGSEWDEFSHWLRAYRYLSASNLLPGGAAAPVFDGCCGAYPYAWPLLSYAAGLFSGFSEALPVLINTLFLGFSGLLLAETARREMGGRQLSWGGVAAGLIGATAACPTFVPKLAFSSYADISTGFLVAVLVVLGERLVAGNEAEEEGRVRAASFGLCGAALLAVKPGNAGLFICILAGVALLLLRSKAGRRALRPDMLLVVALPLLIALLWRWHTDRYLAGQELVVRPVDQWNLREAWGIVSGMAEVASQKGGHFGLGLVAVLLGLRGLWRCSSRADRLMVMVAALFGGYNLFLFSTYLAVFSRQDALRVASFWRYNTHLGLAVTLPVALLAARFLPRLGRRRLLGGAAILLVVAGPLVGLPYVRFDVDIQKQWMRAQLRDLPNRIPAGGSVAVFDSMGSGLSGVMATYEWDGRLNYDGIYSGFTAQQPPEEWRSRSSADWIVVLSGRDRLLGIAAPEGLLLHRRDNAWEVVETLPYPGGTYPKIYP